MIERKLHLPREVSPQSVVAYARFYQMEHWLRELVYLETKAHFGELWWTEVEDAIKRSNTGAISAEKSLKRDKTHNHMSTSENDPLWFLSFDALQKAIFDAQLWPLFECYLTTKELLTAKFTEINPIRNRVAHNRTLHEDDLDRVRRILRDLDKGFWKFCTSFNEVHPFLGDQRTDPIYQYYSPKMGMDYAEVSPGSWALVGNTTGMHLNVMVEFSERPSMQANSTTKAGQIYHFTYSLVGDRRRGLDYKGILERTKQHHSKIIYAIMDSSQQTLRVSIPSLYSPAEVIQVADAFYSSCENMFDSMYQLREEKLLEKPLSEIVDDYDQQNLVFERIASEWPHYVLPPGNAFAILMPDMECSIFEA